MKLTASLTLLIAFSIPLLAGGGGPGINGDAALTALRDGNARYVAGHPQAWHADAAKRAALAEGQHPYACIVTCSDSRVPPEILFDQTLGEIFVIRLAGNVMTPEAVGSVEYAVAHLNVPVVLVLGHSSCGAVKAAIADPNFPGPIQSLVSRIAPAVNAAQRKGGNHAAICAAAINENARMGVYALVQESHAIETALNQGRVSLLSAVYDLQSGEVHWQTQLSAPKIPEPVAAKPATTETHAAPAEKHAETVKPEPETPKTDAQHKSSEQQVTRSKKKTSYDYKRYHR